MGNLAPDTFREYEITRGELGCAATSECQYECTVCWPLAFMTTTTAKTCSGGTETSETGLKASLLKASALHSGQKQ